MPSFFCGRSGGRDRSIEPHLQYQQVGKQAAHTRTFGHTLCIAPLIISRKQAVAHTYAHTDTDSFAHTLCIPQILSASTDNTGLNAPDPTSDAEVIPLDKMALVPLDKRIVNAVYSLVEVEPVDSPKVMVYSKTALRLCMCAVLLHSSPPPLFFWPCLRFPCWRAFSSPRLLALLSFNLVVYSQKFTDF